MNLLGGTALAIGVTYQVIVTGNDSMEQLVRGAMAREAGAVIPVALIAFAALTKVGTAAVFQMADGSHGGADAFLGIVA